VKDSRNRRVRPSLSLGRYAAIFYTARLMRA